MNNNSSFVRIAVVAVLLLLVNGCSDTDSNNVTSEGIEAEITVEATGDGTSFVEARLSVGSGGLFSTDLELENGDRLTATAGGETKVLREEHAFLGGFSYSTSFDTDASGTEFVIAFDRATGTDAPDSRVTLPGAASFVLPTANQTFDLGEVVQISWTEDSLTGNIRLEYTTRCPTLGGSNFFSGSRSIANSGEYPISTGSLLGDAASNILNGEVCTTDIGLIHSKNGQLDPNFGEGGRITAKQIRERRITIVP